MEPGSLNAATPMVKFGNFKLELRDFSGGSPGRKGDEIPHSSFVLGSCPRWRMQGKIP
jgi:hypothetical protein